MLYNKNNTQCLLQFDRMTSQWLLLSRPFKHSSSRIHNKTTAINIVVITKPMLRIVVRLALFVVSLCTQSNACEPRVQASLYSVNRCTWTLNQYLRCSFCLMQITRTSRTNTHVILSMTRRKAYNIYSITAICLRRPPMEWKVRGCHGYIGLLAAFSSPLSYSSSEW